MTKYWIACLTLATAANAAPTVERSLMIDTYYCDRQIEYYTVTPEAAGPFPTLFLVHGAQQDPAPGAKELLSTAERFAQEGILTVAVSMPGYGESDGPRDFCGPYSQWAVADVIRTVTAKPLVLKSKLGIYGLSHGATLASLVHYHYSNLRFQILEAGWYDLVHCLSLLPDYLAKIKESILSETGGTEHALRDRSAIFHTKHLENKTLLLVGEFDDRRTLESTTILHNRLSNEGRDSRLVVFPSELHILSADKWDAILPYVRYQFFGQAGIGIKPVLISPALHIAKILPGSPADRSSRLNVGDVILRISPHNDENEIDVLNMDPTEFSTHLLGPAGTHVRLFVQHFDFSYEDVVIERGL